MNVLFIDDKTQEQLDELRARAEEVYGQDIRNEKFLSGILDVYGEEILRDMNEYGKEASDARAETTNK